jgi:Abnormal spindle-like microcephaly-assoc'd, ASPM-SPD-2-Hydin
MSLFRTLPRGRKHASIGVHVSPNHFSTSQQQTSLSSHRRRSLTAGALGFCLLVLGLSSTANAQHLTVSPSSITFPSTPVNTTSAVHLTISNTGKTKGTVQKVAIGGAGFLYLFGSGVHTIQGGQSLTLTLEFQPKTAGTFNGWFTIYTGSNVNNPTLLKVSLQGVATPAAVGALTVTPGSLAFGTQTVGTTTTQTLTLLNVGSLAVTINGLAVTGAPYALVNAPSSLTLQPMQQGIVTVAADPTTIGTQTGQLTLNNTGSTPVFNVSLSVTGAAATSHTVTLAWNPPSSTPVPITGYLVFRSTSQTSGFVQLDSTPLAGTTYVDQAVKNGETYYYQVESVASGNQTSQPSPTIPVSIPTT